MLQTGCVLILVLKLFEYKNCVCSKKITEFKLKSVPTTKLKINNCYFKVISSIIHEGNIDNGHYTCIVRGDKNKWILVDDNKIQITTWPRNSKNAYMFILQKLV